MACFTAPAAAAIVATGLKKKIDPKYHIDWLILMLWGGVAMLIVDHIATGEIIFHYPFLNNINLMEIVTVGMPMTILVFLIWAVMIAVANRGILQSKLKKQV